MSDESKSLSRVRKPAWIRPLFCSEDFNCCECKTLCDCLNDESAARIANALVLPLQEQISSMRLVRANRLADVERVLEWFREDKLERPAHVAFTDGPERQIAWELERLRGDRDELVKALEQYAAMGTIYVPPDDWSYSKNGGGPSVDDYERFDISEIAREALAKVKEGK